MARNSQVFDYFITRQTIACQVELIVYLRVIDFEILWESNFRCIDKLHVTSARNDKLDSNRIVSLELLSIDAWTNGEFPYSAREVAWLACRKFLHIDNQFRSNEILLNIDDVTSIEECIKRIGWCDSLWNGSFESYRWDFYLSCLLWEENQLTPDGSVIVSSVIVFQCEGLLIWKFHFLGMETFQIRNIPS